MLYIAEVKRQTKGFIGGSKAVLQLLACQRNDQSWSAVPGEEVVPCDDTQVGDGALVMVNLANRQIQGNIEPAGPKIVSLLQNFSKAVEKSRSQEEEIEEWRQSLTYQAQELNRREMELEASREQLERQEEELELLEQRRQEMEANLEQLQQQQEQLGQQVVDAGPVGASIGAENASELKRLVGQLAAAIAPAAQVGGQVSALQATITQQQNELSQQRARDTPNASSNISALRQQLLRERDALEQSRQQLTTCRSAIEAKQEATQLLARQLHTWGELRDILVRVAVGSTLVRLSPPIDPATLDSLSDADLESRVKTLEQDLNKIRPFVSDQEEELKLQLQSVQELEQQLGGASASDRNSLTKELDEERDRYRFLEETLLGQRRTLKVREEVLSQHRRALQRRQGNLSEASPAGSTPHVELGPILDRIEAQRNVLEDELHKLESEAEQLQQQAKQTQELVELRSRQQEAQHQELSRAETAAPPVDLGQAYEKQQAVLQQIQQSIGTIARPLQQVSGLQQTVSQLEEVVRSVPAS